MQTVNANGAAIPAIGFGTWPMRGDLCANIVSAALKIGYRHVDTAQGYQNESEVGAGMADAGVPRERIFITTKVRPEWTSDGRLQQSLEESLKKLRVDVIDLVLLHWPNPNIPVAESIKALCDAKRKGLTRHIGLSNYTTTLLDQAIKTATEPLAAEQIEYHPFLDQSKMLAALRRNGMAVIAFGPIALGEAADHAVLASIGKAHGKTAAQVSLRWLLQQRDVIPIPKTAHVERLKENFDVFDFVLSEAEMTQIAGLSSRNLRNTNEPAWVAKWD